MLLFTPSLSQDPPCATVLEQVLAERHVVRVSRHTELIDMVPDLLRATNEVSARLQEAAASSTAYPAVV